LPFRKLKFQNALGKSCSKTSVFEETAKLVWQPIKTARAGSQTTGFVTGSVYSFLVTLSGKRPQPPAQKEKRSGPVVRHIGEQRFLTEVSPCGMAKIYAKTSHIMLLSHVPSSD
jgi:hypothetical protein